jgi:transcriptional regulator with XRE-family HTH domain
MSHVSAPDRIPSGLGDLDEILGGLLAGDNVAWVCGDPSLCAQVERSMLAARPAGQPALYVSASSSETDIRAGFGEGLTVIDSRQGSPYAEPVMLEQAIVMAAKSGANRIVIDGLEVFTRRWGVEKAIAFFKRVCPRLFDLGTIAYWRAPRGVLGNAGIEEIRKVTQCVFELSDKQLRVVKAEGHSATVQGRLFRVLRDKDTIRLHAERAIGRLAQGLRTVRSERSLTQADLARLAEVSPSALSQAEAGQRGLSLDTLLTLTSRLRIGLDDLLDNSPSQDYVLARRDRGAELGASKFLLDDPSAGLRVYLVVLDPGEQRTPPVAHKGAELVLVARGLVLVDLGSSSPAVRAGDAILAAKVPVLSWRNLAPDASVLFWILRD